jgi:hypothetical protein
LAATLSSLDDASLAETWVIGTSSADSSSGSENQSTDAFEVIDLDCQFIDFQAKWSVDGLVANTVQVSDFQDKWDTGDLVQNTVTATDLQKKWEFSSFRRDYT